LENNNGTPNLFRDIAKKADIVQVVSFYLGSQALIRSGKTYKVTCPFHAHDAHPSCVIDPQRNTYHCWSCGAKGDSISFAEEYAHLKPMDALRKVCEICSIPLPDTVQKESFVPEIEKKYPEELKALLDLKKFYQLMLLSPLGKDGKDYLEGRKIPSDVIAYFGIGFAPKDPKLAIQSLRKLGYEIPVLERAGILANSSIFEDRYSERILFPIEDSYGHVVGFSGRKIRKDQPLGKYINYPLTPLFEKSTILYNFSNAREEARKAGFLYVCEGFMDVIAYYRAGIKAVIGTMGTALTKEHCRMLKSLNAEIRLALDSDEPGQEGDERAAKVLFENQVPFRVEKKFSLLRKEEATGLDIPCKDADEVLTFCGPEKLQSQSERLNDPYRFLLGRRMGNRLQMKDSKEIMDFFEEARPYFQSLNPVEQEQDIEFTTGTSENHRDPFIVLSKDAARSILLAKASLPPVREKKPAFKEEEKVAYTKPSSSFRKNRKGRWEKEEEQEYMIGSVVKKEPDLLSAEESILRIALSYPGAQGIDSELLKSETWLLLMVPASSLAAMALKEGKVTFAFLPYDFLYQILASYYIYHPETRGLDRNRMGEIQSILETKTFPSDKKEVAKVEKKPENDDIFEIDDMDDLEEDKDFEGYPVLDKPVRDFLLSLVPILSGCLGASFSKESFEKEIWKEKTLKKIHVFTLETNRKEGNYSSWTLEEQEKLREYQKDLHRIKRGLLPKSLEK